MLYSILALAALIALYVGIVIYGFVAKDKPQAEQGTVTPIHDRPLAREVANAVEASGIYVGAIPRMDVPRRRPAIRTRHTKVW